MEDRRKSSRMSVFLRATLYIQGNELIADIIDISETGMCLAVKIEDISEIKINKKMSAWVQFVDTVFIHRVSEDYIERVPIRIVYCLEQEDRILIGCSATDAKYAKYVSMKKFTSAFNES